MRVETPEEQFRIGNTLESRVKEGLVVEIWRKKITTTTLALAPLPPIKRPIDRPRDGRRPQEPIFEFD